MKKFYLFLAAMMISISSFAVDYYTIAGGFNGWAGEWKMAADYKLTAQGDGTYVIDLSKGTYTDKDGNPVTDISGEFLIVGYNGNSADWSTATRKKTGDVVPGTPYSCNIASSGSNLMIANSATVSNAKVTFNPTAKTVLVEGQEVGNEFEQVYLIGDFGDGWSETITDYPLTAVEGKTDTYAGTFTISSTAALQDYFFFKPKCGAATFGSPSGADLEPAMGKEYTLTPSDKSLMLKPGTYTFTAVADQAGTSCKLTVTQDGPVVLPDITVYWDNALYQWNEIYCIATDADGNAYDADGIMMTMVENAADVWMAKFPGNYTKVQFTNYEGGESIVFDAYDEYLYTLNSSSYYPIPKDYTGWYVNCLGNFNSWGDNGVAVGKDGIAVHESLAIGTSEFKIKIWNGEEIWLSTGGAIALGEWVEIPGNSDTNMRIAGAAADDVFKVEFNCANNSIRVTKAAEADYSTYYVNIVGDFNAWEYNGVQPNAEGIAICEASDVNTTFKVKVWNGTADMWYAANGEIALDTPVNINGNADTMTLPAEAQSGKVIMTFNCKTGYLTVTKSSGVDSIIAAEEEAAPVYYNLQGVRVDNPSEGLYIVVRGSKVAKEIVR